MGGSSLTVFGRKSYRRTFLGELKRALWVLRKKRKVVRTSNRVSASYENVYTLSNEKWEESARSRRYEVVLGEELLTVDGLWISMYYARLIDLWIRVLDAKKVLEVGSGRGSVLFELVRLNPTLELTGLERSAQGILRSREKQKVVGTHVTFVVGEARELPFADKTFDVAFTVHVLESMPRDYHKAVAEMARVARYGIFVEEFREAQSIGDLAWLRFKDYFRDSYKKLDLQPLYFSKDIPHIPKYSMGILVGKLS